MSKEKGMKTIMRKAICFAVLASTGCYFIGIGQASDAKEPENHTIAEGAAIHLSDDLKVILNQEMKKHYQDLQQILQTLVERSYMRIN